MYKTFAFTFVIVCLTSSVANAQITAVVSQNADPAPGLTSVTVSAVAGGGEIINTFAGINISTPVHNVVPGFGSAGLFASDWAADGDNGDSLAAWSVFDTYVLFNDPTDFVFQLGSPLGEGANDGSDPAGLSLMGGALAPTTGLSTLAHPNSTDLITILPALASGNIPFLQVVFPTGTSPLLSMSFFDSVTGNESIVTDVPLAVGNGGNSPTAIFANAPYSVGTPTTPGDEILPLTLDATPSTGDGPLTFAWDLDDDGDFDDGMGAELLIADAIGQFGIGFDFPISVQVTNNLGSSIATTTVDVIPEPASLLLASMGLIGIVAARRRRVT